VKRQYKAFLDEFLYKKKFNTSGIRAAKINTFQPGGYRNEVCLIVFSYVCIDMG